MLTPVIVVPLTVDTVKVAPLPEPPVTVATSPTYQLVPPVVTVIPVTCPAPLTEVTVKVAPDPAVGNLWYNKFLIYLE